MKLMGYKRENGTFGIKKSSVDPANFRLFQRDCTKNCCFSAGSSCNSHQHGCCQVGADYLQTVNTLVGFGKNPNVGAVLVVQSWAVKEYSRK